VRWRAAAVEEGGARAAGNHGGGRGSRAGAMTGVEEGARCNGELVPPFGYEVDRRLILRDVVIGLRNDIRANSSVSLLYNMKPEPIRGLWMCPRRQKNYQPFDPNRRLLPPSPSLVAPPSHPSAPPPQAALPPLPPSSSFPTYCYFLVPVPLL
jgi:hypothetical protein